MHEQITRSTTRLISDKNFTADRDAITSDFIEPSNVLWADVLRRTRHDFYHLPGYVELCGRIENAKPLAFYARSDHGECLIPLLSRPVRAACNGLHWFDLISPYGYCSPLFTSASSEDHSALLSMFHGAMRDMGAVSAFLRMHPLLHSRVTPLRTLQAIVDHGETVWIDLTLSEQDLWKQMRDGHRYEIRRLQKLNYVSVLDDWGRYNEFIDLYTSTMRRRNAGASYFFDDEYFCGLKSVLGSRLHLCCVVSPEGDVAAAGLFTTMGDLMQYHLSGVSDRHQHLAPTKLMLDFMCGWGRRNEISCLHLGGGVGTRYDSLFKFKAGFSPLRAHFHTIRLISNEQRFQSLLAPEAPSFDVNAELVAPFFPSYRNPALARSADASSPAICAAID